MSSCLRLLAALLTAALVAALSATATAAPAVLTEPAVPPPNMIVLVEGDAANGFAIEHYDGTWDYPPTRSEAFAECGEYDRFVRRVRCRVDVRTWYFALDRLKDTTHYYRALLRQ